MNEFFDCGFYNECFDCGFYDEDYGCAQLRDVQLMT